MHLQASARQLPHSHPGTVHAPSVTTQHDLRPALGEPGTSPPQWEKQHFVPWRITASALSRKEETRNLGLPVWQYCRLHFSHAPRCVETSTDSDFILVHF